MCNLLDCGSQSLFFVLALTHLREIHLSQNMNTVRIASLVLLMFTAAICVSGLNIMLSWIVRLNSVVSMWKNSFYNSSNNTDCCTKRNWHQMDLFCSIWHYSSLSLFFKIRCVCVCEKDNLPIEWFKSSFGCNLLIFCMTICICEKFSLC